MSVMRVISRRRARRAVVTAALLLACAGTATATESGRAERLYTKGLAELHDGHNDAAIALFQQAVAADPNDIHGIYYRGLGYGHVGRYVDAVADLRKVVAANDPARSARMGLQVLAAHLGLREAADLANKIVDIGIVRAKDREVVPVAGGNSALFELDLDARCRSPDPKRQRVSAAIKTHDGDRWRRFGQLRVAGEPRDPAIRAAIAQHDRVE